jgi:hypothetical protein
MDTVVKLHVKRYSKAVIMTLSKVRLDTFSQYGKFESVLTNQYKPVQTL